jgi:hypothetical protein
MVIEPAIDGYLKTWLSWASLTNRASRTLIGLLM